MPRVSACACLFFWQKNTRTLVIEVAYIYVHLSYSYCRGFMCILLHATRDSFLCNNCWLSNAMENIYGCKVFASWIFFVALESLQLSHEQLQRVACNELHMKPGHNDAKHALGWLWTLSRSDNARFKRLNHWNAELRALFVDSKGRLHDVRIRA